MSDTVTLPRETVRVLVEASRGWRRLANAIIGANKKTMLQVGFDNLTAAVHQAEKELGEVSR